MANVARKPAGGTALGAVTEETFHQAFLNTASVPIYSSKDLSEYVTKIKDGLSASPEDWNRRVDALKNLRNMIAANCHQFEDFYPLLKTLESPVESCLSDLRSAVVREACIVVAFMSQELGNRFDHFAEMVLPSMLALIPNSAKIMASSGIVAISFVMRRTFSPRLLPIIAGSASSKSNVMRRYMCEFLELIFECWPTHILEKHLALIRDTLRRGLNDADQDARAASRRAFPAFANKFPAEAESLMQSLEPSKRKMLEKSMPNSMRQDSGDTSAPSSCAGSQVNLAAGSSKGVTRRPSRPVLGTTAANAGATTRRPATGTANGNSTSTLGRGPRKMSALAIGRSTVGRKMISQSQPASRETSPTRSSYGGVYEHVQSSGYGKPSPFSTGYGGTHGTFGKRYARGSRIPHSQGPSREGSPTNSTSGIPTFSAVGLTESVRRSSTSSGLPPNRPRRPIPSSMSDVGDGDTAAYGYRHQYESDDNLSETSSMCSDRSGRSVSSRYRRTDMMRSTNRFSEPPIKSNVSEIVGLLTGLQWSEKKDGLLNLQDYLRSRNRLNPHDISRVTDAFGSIFDDTSSKVVPLFLDTLQLFIKEYKDTLNDWSFVVLLRLLHRQGHEVSAAHQKAIQETLSVVRSQFPLDIQFSSCCRIVLDNNETSKFKVRSCVLEYIKDLLLLMPAENLDNPSSEVITAVSRIINWSTELKSADVRRMASRVIMKLFDLNPSSISALLQHLPRHFQEQVSKLLKTYQKQTTVGSVCSFDGMSTTSNYNIRKSAIPTPHYAIGQQHFSPITANQENLSPQSLASDGAAFGYSPSSNASGDDRRGLHDGVSPQSLRYPPLSSNGISPQYAQQQQHTLVGDDFYMQDQNQPPVNNMSPMRILPQQRSLLSSFDQTDEMPPEDVMTEILQELSNHNERYEQRKACMLKLIKMLRDGTIRTWEEHSKPTLLILLESLGDNSGETRALALRVLQELVRSQADLVQEYACLTVMKILESCKDTDKAVTRSAEECAQTIAQYLPQDFCLHLLSTVINDTKAQLSLPAVKMQEQVIKASPPELVREVISELVPGLIDACSHDESSMRKASIFCLVEIVIKVGDDVWDHLKELNASKKRLLMLYIDKRRSRMSNESIRTGYSVPQ